MCSLNFAGEMFLNSVQFVNLCMKNYSKEKKKIMMWLNQPHAIEKQRCLISYAHTEETEFEEKGRKKIYKNKKNGTVNTELSFKIYKKLLIRALEFISLNYVFLSTEIKKQLYKLTGMLQISVRRRV